MKKLTTLFVLFIFLNPTISFSQKQANHWYFGMLAGIDFTNGAPVADMNGALNTAEGCSTISDTSGNLLFYTDGITVYNRFHGTMPNSGDLMGDVSSTQSALIVPKPNNPNLYYVFTTDADGGSDGFRYSIVDLTLDTGKGDVSIKNVLIKNFPTEKISAVGNPTGTGVWVMTHDWGTDAFYAYFLSDTGFNMVPVISHTGTVHSTANFQNTYGQMKFSPNGKKLALGIGYQGMYELFDFDNATGIVSHPITFNTTKSSYGLEFSPDSRKLYTTRYDNLNDVYYLDQFNLAAGNDAQIIASQYPLSNADVMRQLQLGPDGKIYMAKFNTPYLAVINNPNGLGVACNFVDNAVLLDASMGGLNLCGLGLPGFVQSFFFRPPAPESAFLADDTVICPGNCVSFHNLSLNHPTEWHWHFPGATPDTSSLENPQNICYPAPGYYPVSLVTGNANGFDSITVNNYVEVYPLPPISISVSGDTFNVYNAVSQQWYLNGNPINGATGTQYIGAIPGSYTVMVTDVNGCTATSNSIIISGIENLQNFRSLKVYPVPASGYLHVVLPDDVTTGATLTIQNVLGETLAAKTIDKSNTRIDILDLPSGYYLVRINTAGGVWSSGFMKE